MIRTIFCFSLVAFLAGCGSDCESIQDQIEHIGREIQKKPETAFDRAQELEALTQKLKEKGCLG